MNLEEMSEEQIESEALKQGYNPDYEGENKKSPKEFLEVAFNHNNVLKERNEKLSQQIEEINKRLEKQQAAAEKLVQFQEEQKKKAVENAIKELKKERKEAIADSDHEKVEQIDQQIEAAKKEEPKPSPAIEKWIADNPWYNDDPELGAEADYYAKIYHESGRFQSEEALIKAVEKKVKSSNPEKFKNPKKDAPPETEGGRPSSQKSKKSYDDLPQDAKQACDEFVAEGIMTRDQYVSMYEWE